LYYVTKLNKGYFLFVINIKYILFHHIIL
jgi:hypothetical protein